MRVATKTMYDLVEYNLSNITEKLNNANKIVSSGKRIIDLSDDPVGLTQALELKSVLSNIDQMNRNISMGNSWLAAAEGALGYVQDLISDAKELCVQMGSSTASGDQRQSAAETVQNILDEIISLANTQVSGRYIFAGSDTDTAPFEEDGTYNGNNTPFTIKVGSNSTVQIGNDGETIFSDIFDTLNALKADLESDNTEGILSAMDDLDVHFDAISARISDVGSKMNRMEIKESILQELEISNTDRLSEIEDADIAEAVMELSAVELAYEAALASSSQIMELSLVDYLK